MSPHTSTATHYEAIQSLGKIYLEAMDRDGLCRNLEINGPACPVVHARVPGLSPVSPRQAFLFWPQLFVSPAAVHNDLYVDLFRERVVLGVAKMLDHLSDVAGTAQRLGHGAGGICIPPRRQRRRLFFGLYRVQPKDSVVGGSVYPAV